jgi:hypothetical protein
VATGVDCNLSLFNSNRWEFPHNLEGYFEGELFQDIEKPNLLPSRGRTSNYSKLEYEIASTLKVSSRISPSQLDQTLERRNIAVGPKKIARILQKIYKNEVVLPYTAFGLGLTSSLCFEIICSEDWKNRIAASINHLPHTIYLVSDRGIILWTLIPGYHQVEYYKLFRNLETHPGVKSVESIMTISRKGSKSILDLTAELEFGKSGFTTHPTNLDITQYITDI